MHATLAPALGAGVAGGFLALVFLALALRANHRRRLVDNLPTSKTTGVFIGLVEVQGTAESAHPLRSFLAEIPCVHYQYEVAEHWSRTVTETYTDSRGHRRTRTRQESGWKTVASGGEMIPFYLQDDYGAVFIRPQGATLEPRSVFSTICGRADPLYYAKGPAGAVAHSDYRRRFSEQAIPLHAPLYVMGQARERQDVVAPEIAADSRAPLFLISTRTEKEISRRYGWGWYGWSGLGWLCATGGAVMSWGTQASPVLAGAAATGLYGLALFIGWTWVVFNSMVDLRNRVQQAWSLVDVQLKRRHDLIPNLVAAVSGLRDYERDVQETLALLRAQGQATAPGEPGPDPAAVGQRLLALAERYPKLKAQESFLRLQRELADTETRIALARGYYNEIATHHNLRLELIPDRWLARLAGLRPRALMEANDFQRPPVIIS